MESTMWIYTSAMSSCAKMNTARYPIGHTYRHLVVISMAISFPSKNDIWQGRAQIILWKQKNTTYLGFLGKLSIIYCKYLGNKLSLNRVMMGLHTIRKRVIEFNNLEFIVGILILVWNQIVFMGNQLNFKHSFQTSTFWVTVKGPSHYLVVLRGISIPIQSFNTAIRGIWPIESYILKYSESVFMDAIWIAGPPFTNMV